MTFRPPADRADPFPVLASVTAGDVCVGIATRGRPVVLARVVEQLRRQTVRPSAVIVAATCLDDVATLREAADVTVLIEKPGLARQRNAILRAMPADARTVVFFDDDFVPGADWIEAALRLFQADARVDCITGAVLADGIKGAGLTMEEAHAVLARDDGAHRDVVEEGISPYGCNMAFRASAIAGLRFDEKLVLYGWLEDLDFGAALARRGGRRVKLHAARGVHLGEKSGRVGGLRLGYSQVVNPAYLGAKGAMSLAAVVRQIARNVAANVLRAPRPEPYVDRLGRLRGNFIGLVDLLRGRLDPERAADL